MGPKGMDANCNLLDGHLFEGRACRVLQDPATSGSQHLITASDLRNFNTFIRKQPQRVGQKCTSVKTLKMTSGQRIRFFFRYVENTTILSFR